jgi:flagellin-like protein
MTKISNVRKATKFKRSIKAISPVIATLLMIAIAVVASLVVYAWVTGYIGGKTTTAGKAIAIPSFSGVANPGTPNFGNLVVYVQNVGQGTVEVSAVYVDDALIDNADLAYDPTPPGEVISEGNTVKITIDKDFDLTVKHSIKVTTTEGTFMTITGKSSNSGGGNPVNNAPVANADSYSTMVSTPLVKNAAAGVLDNDVDSDGNSLTAIKVADPTHGTVVLSADGSFMYTPTTGYVGSDSFTYKANDGLTDSGIATVSITVTTVTPKMYVESITMEFIDYIIVKFGTGVVTIVDSSGYPVSGATVSGTWSGDATNNVNGMTDTNGRITFYSDGVWFNFDQLTFTLTITDVVKTGVTYDSSANLETSDSASG